MVPKIKFMRSIYRVKETTRNALEFLEDGRRSFEVVEELEEIFVAKLLRLLLEETRYCKCDWAESVVRMRQILIRRPPTSAASITDGSLASESGSDALVFRSLLQTLHLRHERAFLF